MVEIREISEPVTRFERVGAHSHISGLGLEKLKAKKIADGMVGQREAREAAGTIVDLVKKGKFSGRAILLAGPPGTGKTAIAVGIAKELGKDVPFIPISGSEIYSTEIKRTEFLTQALRKAIGARIHEMRKIYEGVVEKVDIEQVPHPYNPYAKVPRNATIKLRTKDQTKELRVDQAIARSLAQQGVEEGDVIQIDAETGRLTVSGKSREKIKELKMDITSAEAVEVPSGPVLKDKEFVYTLTLHNLDVVNSRQSGMFSIFFGGGGGEEISSDIRNNVDEQIKAWVEEERAEIIPGVLFIDEVNMLDIESLSFLNRAMEGELAPIIILASNRGITKIRGTDVKSPHGLPLDMLDRVLIINTHKYTRDEILEILKIRMAEEKIEIEEDAIEYLADVGEKTSLRYAVQLMAPASEVAKEKDKKITVKHIKRVENLFADVKRSVDYLHKYEKEMIT